MGGVDVTYLAKSTLFVNSFGPYGWLSIIATFPAKFDGLTRLDRPEVHWYEAAGIGRKEFKIKHLL